VERPASPLATGRARPVQPPQIGGPQRFPALGLFLMLAVGAWSYAPTLGSLVSTWASVADYSHGFFVPPLALYFLWSRRAYFPVQRTVNPLLGGTLFLASVATRYAAAHYYLSFLDGWSLLTWLAAAAATLGGTRLLQWTAPSIGFLAFMIPLPFGAEIALSHPLQRIATTISCYALQLLGQPAFTEGNIILVGEHQLEVAQACSGLRLFVFFIALAYAYIVLIRRDRWEKLLVVVATVPIALACNAARIVVTGLILQLTSSERMHALAHDLARWGMIPLATVSFWLLLWYVGLLFRNDDPLDVKSLVRRASLS
jgi:exosortase